MNTEIELKFLVLANELTNQTESKITDVLHAKKFNFDYQQITLINSYFDTPDYKLRHLDMGLRVRTCVDDTSNKSIEQTIKTAGKSVGGLHQRPEYNVDIDNNFPQLSLFPPALWADKTHCETLQNELVSLFTTNFTRTIWQVTLGNDDANQSIIELVFDQGVIESNGKQEPICEIELELHSGKVEDIFLLAKALSFSLPVRPGIKSKAARGYALWQQNDKKSEDELDPNDPIDLSGLALIPLGNVNGLNDVFIKGTEFGLTQLQSLVDAYTETPVAGILKKITEMLALLRQGFWLFDACLDEDMKKLRNELSFFIKKLHWVEDVCHLKELTTKTGNYRKKLHYSDSLIAQLKSERNNYPDKQSNIELFHSARFNRLQLSLLSLLLKDKEALHLAQLNGLESDVLLFAKKALSTNLQNLIDVMPANQSMTSQGYFDQHKILIRSLLTGSWFGALFDKEERLAFRNPWLDVKNGISELETLHLLHQQLLKLEVEEVKLAKWLTTKSEHLLLTLEQSRQQALCILPYWQKSYN